LLINRQFKTDCQQVHQFQPNKHLPLTLINVREYRRENKKGQSRETGNIGYTKRRKTKQKQNTLCIGQHYTQTNINNVN